MTSNEIIAWLESPAGEWWSSQHHSRVTTLMTVKDDGPFDNEEIYYETWLWVA